MATDPVAPAATMTMFAPDGTTGEIPLQKVRDAQAAGFTAAVTMKSPDGKNGYVPANRVHDAAQKGFQMVPMDAPEATKASFWDALTNPVGSGAHAQGVVGGAEQVGGQAIKAAVQPFMHPIDTLTGAAKVATDYATSGPAAAGQDIVAPVVQQYAQDQQQGGNALALENLAGQVAGNVEGGRVMGSAVSGIKPSATLGPAGEAPVPGGEGPVNTVGGVNRMIPEAVQNGTVPSAWDFVNNRLHPKALLTGDVNAPIPGTAVTPAARYQSMKDMGIQPNAAEATNSTPLNIAEKVNQNSLTAAKTYADARASNLNALNDYTEHVLDSMSTKGPEGGGAAVQQGLLKSHADLKTAATEAYQDLDDQAGNQPLPGTAGLREQAQAILDANGPYYKAHPELEPTKAMAIVRDLAGAKGPGRPAPKVIPGFGPEAAAPEVEPPPDLTYTELHRLRSDLLDFNNTNPDLVKNQANGWIARLASAADHAITSSEGGLTPDQVGTFRNANEAWKFMKDTFDNPSHPFYQAVRTMSPSTLVNGISKTPEMAKMLQGVLQPNEMGAIQRGVAENLLRITKEGRYNFKTFQGQWNKLPEAYRDALFTPEQQEQLEGIGHAGTVLNTDLNPSGSARLGQGIAEGGEFARSMLNPHEFGANLAYHGAQYGLGKLMNSPAFVDWLMRGKGFAPVQDAGAAAPVVNRMIPAAVASGAVTSGWDFENNRPKAQ